MSYAEALLVILFTAIAAVVATNFVRRALGLDVRRQHHEVGNPVYLQIGVVFAVLLAFVFNEVWGEYNAAAQAINGECGALHGAAMLAHDLPDGHGRGVEQAILNYSKVVINVEWAALQHRKASPEAVSAFQAIVEAAGHLTFRQSTQGNPYFSGKPGFANHYLAGPFILWSCTSGVCAVRGSGVANCAFFLHRSLCDFHSVGFDPCQNARLPL